MAASVNQVLAQVERWTAAARTVDVADAVLLRHYTEQRDQAAFAALVARHGGIVLRLCRRILGDAHAAEDAFQAVFVILARKAHSLKQPDALSAWLYGVARRVALKAHGQARRRNSSASCLDETLPDPHPDPLAQLSARELLDILDEEVGQLPAAQRSAVILCCLEGHSRDEAARILGWTQGAVKGHLQRGRQRLQDRLARRGIVLSAALALVSVAHGETASELLLRSTVTEALGGGIGSSAAVLAHSVLKSMFLARLAGMTALILTVVLAASVTALVYRGPEPAVPEDKTPPFSIAAKADTDKPRTRTDAHGDPLPDGALRRLGTLRFRHGGGNICDLLLTKDGKTLVSNTYYGSRTVCVWDMATGKLLRQFPGSFDHRSIGLSANGKLIAVGQEKAIVLWGLASGKEVRRFAQPDATGFAFSPDDKILAAAGSDPDIHLWEVASGKSLSKIAWKRSPTSVAQLAFTPDGKTLIAGQHFDSKISLFDVASGKKHHELDASGGDIFSFALSPDGSVLATGGRKGGIPIWDVKTGKLLRKLRTEEKNECTTAAFSPNGKILAALEHDFSKQEQFLSLWDVASGKELSRFKGDIAFWSLVFSPDGKTLIAGWDSAIRLWDVATGKEIGPAANSPAVAYATTVSGDGRILAFLEKNIRLWDIVRDREIGSLPRSTEDGLALAFSPDGKTLATGTIFNTLSLWDVGSRKRIRTLKGDAKNDGLNYGHFTAIAFAPDGKTFASAGGDGVVRIWEAASGKELRHLSMKDNPNVLTTSEAVAFSPDGKTLAASGRGPNDRSKVCLWNVATGKPLAHLNARLNDPADKGPPYTGFFPGGPIIEPKICFSPNGHMLAMNRWQKSIPVWEAATGRQRLLLEGHEASTVCVAFAPDGSTLASASWDNIIRLWDLATGRELSKLTGHRGKANSLAFSTDGKILVSAGDDTTVLFWDVAEVTQRKRPQSSPLAPHEWQALWEDLAKDDAAKAYTAMVRMVADGPTTIAALKERLHPIRPADPKRLAQLLKELDSDDYAVREAANGELKKLGDVALPAVRQALARPGLSLEMRRRLEAIAEAFEELSGERLRQVRATEVLELAGTKEARERLATLAAGAEAARLTEEAKAALERLAKREGN
jgi:RNA polymerase sigma factor (sigma-70 family)